MDEEKDRITGDKHPEGKSANSGSNLPRGMDPNYSTHKGDYPWNRPQTTGEKSASMIREGDPTSIQVSHADVTALRGAELRRRLQLMPSGQRIRNLRLALGWTQWVAAAQLGISVRTVIRHEQGCHRRPWMRLKLLLRLCELESEYAEPIVAYLARVGVERR
jgi:DNA-binding transcriptional regulator YiaG